MSNEPGAVLVVELGSLTTRVTLVDSVEGETRLLGQAEVPSTTEPPFNDATIAIRNAVAQLEPGTGRQLLLDGQLAMPQNAERDGVNAVVATTSAAGYMSLVVAAVSSDVSARSALRASHATYTSVLQTITLNDTAEAADTQDLSWIERQVQRLLTLRPDVVLLSGGLEHGAEDALVRLAHIVGLTASSTRDAGAIGPGLSTRQVIFAGNSAGRERVIEALSQSTSLRVVDNLRPRLEVEQLEPARQALLDLYAEQKLPTLPGMPALRRLCAAPIHTTAEATGLMTRFLAEQNERNVLTVDVGAANTAAFLQSQGRFSPFVLGGVGMRYGIGTLLAEHGPGAIARWLPFQIDEQELVHRLLHVMLRPALLPSSLEEVLIDHAIAREALGQALAALRDERDDAPFDMVLLCGGVFAHVPHPGYAALLALDVLQLDAQQSDRAVDLHLDTLGLVNASGTLAYHDAGAAVALLENDLLANTPLATCVATSTTGRARGVAVEAELEVVGGGRQQITVEHGQIGRLPLPIGQRARLNLRPARNVRIGRNAPGQEAASDIAIISGSLLGVLIDARERPLLPTNPAERQQALWNWLTTLGAVSGVLPFELAPQTAAPPNEPEAAPNGSTAQPVEESTDLTLVAQPLPPDAPELDADLARLRQTVEEPPKKRGWLRK